MKQETSEEASWKFNPLKMYSEEEVLELLRKAHFVEQNIDEWFEQFKKKSCKCVNIEPLLAR